MEWLRQSVRDSRKQYRNEVERFMAISAELKGHARRLKDPNNICGSISNMDAATMAKQVDDSNAKATPPKTTSTPAVCVQPMLNFIKVMCSSACKSSPLTADINFGRRSGNRRLLGGIGGTGSSDALDPSNPAKSCSDPCFQPYMSSVMSMMTTVLGNKQCSSLMSDSRRALGPSRSLLGGTTTQSKGALKTMEIMMGMMCSKNAKGDYCMKLYSDMDNQGSGSATSFASAPAGSGSAAACPSAAEKAKLQELGCCWGNMELLFTQAMTMEEKGSGSAVSTKDSLKILRNEAATCGVTLSSKPCSDTAVSVAAIDSTVKLAGVTSAQFNAVAQKAYKKGVAKAAGEGAVVNIKSFKDVTGRRATELQVDSQVQLVGASASSASVAKVQANLQNKAAVQSSIQAEAVSTGSPALQAATVQSSSQATTYKVKGTAAVNSVGASAGSSILLLAVGVALALIQQ
jgi:hypothetical protein